MIIIGELCNHGDVFVDVYGNNIALQISVISMTVRAGKKYRGNQYFDFIMADFIMKIKTFKYAHFLSACRKFMFKLRG